MAHRRKRFLIPVTAAVIAAAAAVIVLVLVIGKPQSYEPVSREEYLLIYENEVRPRVLILSQDPGGDWYNESYEDTTLGEYAQALTAAALAEYKAKQRLFRENGLWDFAYEDFLLQWRDQENDGNPYGVQAYSQYDYYVYLHSVYSLQLMQGYTVEGADAKRYYEENKDQFRNADAWELEVWKTDSRSGNAQAVLQQAMLGDQTAAAEYARITLDADAAKYHPEILLLAQEHLEQLKTPGHTVYAENDGTYFLLRSAGFTEGQYIPYQECEELVRSRCRQQMLERAVAKELEDITIQKQLLPAVGK